jgi:hypothetical protein
MTRLNFRSTLATVFDQREVRHATHFLSPNNSHEFLARSRFLQCTHASAFPVPLQVTHSPGPSVRASQHTIQTHFLALVLSDVNYSNIP